MLFIHISIKPDNIIPATTVHVENSISGLCSQNDVEHLAHMT